MSAPAPTPYLSSQPAGSDGFGQVLRAEWTKFRTVRGWVVGLLAVALLTGLAVVALAGAAGNHNSKPEVATGPGGEAVTDTFYFVRQPLAGNGSVTVRVTSLTGIIVQPGHTMRHAVSWAKAGVIIREGTAPGSEYAAMMVTPGHGVRFQDNFTGDTAGLPGATSGAAPRWLRLTRTGERITGYDSADGTHWSRVGAITLAGLSSAAQAGLFVASPEDLVQRQTFANNDGVDLPTLATATFDHLTLVGGQPGAAWSSGQVGPGLVDWQTLRPGRRTGTPGPARTKCHGICPDSGPLAGSAQESGGTYTIAGSGDIAPYQAIIDPTGTTFKAVLFGLLAVIALGTLFVTSEYRRGLIRTTLAASPRRGRILVAKAIVIGSATFVAGLAGAAAAFPITQQQLRASGWTAPVYQAIALTSATGLRVTVGTAALFAVAAVLAVAAGAVLRRSAGAIAAVIVLVILPLILGIVLPMTPAQWILRLTPAAAFGLQQANPRYPQVTSSCLPYNGCYPLAPWTGFAVMCAWAVVALGLAAFLLRRRDA